MRIKKRVCKNPISSHRKDVSTPLELTYGGKPEHRFAYASPRLFFSSEIRFSDSTPHALYRAPLTCASFSYKLSTKIRPHRLEAQDISLSRKKRGFEFPWGYRKKTSAQFYFVFLSYLTSRGYLHRGIEQPGSSQGS